MKLKLWEYLIDSEKVNLRKSGVIAETAMKLKHMTATGKSIAGTGPLCGKKLAFPAYMGFILFSIKCNNKCK